MLNAKNHPAPHFTGSYQDLSDTFRWVLQLHLPLPRTWAFLLQEHKSLSFLLNVSHYCKMVAFFAVGASQSLFNVMGRDLQWLHFNSALSRKPDARIQHNVIMVWFLLLPLSPDHFLKEKGNGSFKRKWIRTLQCYRIRILHHWG